MHRLAPGVSVCTVMKALFLEHNWEFDYYLSESSVLFSITLPLTSSFAGIVFNHKAMSIYECAVYREGKRAKFYMTEAIKTSVRISLCFFVPMLVQYAVLYFTAKGHMYGEVGVHLLLDFLGKQFYYLHPYLYWLMNVTLRFLVCPFCYGMLACGIGMHSSSAKETMWLSNVYYYGLMLIGLVCTPLFGNILNYINPFILLADGGSFWFVNYNSFFMTLVSAGIPLILGVIGLLYKNDYRFS
jgi:hypothetical protein